MRFKSRVLLFAAVGAAILFCGTAEAGPFGLFGRKKAAKQIQAPANQSKCVYQNGECVTHGSSQVANQSGPVTAQQLESAGGTFYRTNEPEIKTESLVVPSETATTNADANSAEAPNVEAPNVEAAQQQVTVAEDNLFEKEDALLAAQKAEHLQNEKDLIALEALAVVRNAERQQESKELQLRIKDLREKIELFTCCDPLERSIVVVPTLAPPKGARGAPD